MTGAASRRRGHDAERSVVRWLRAHGYPDAHTTRSRLGHDGFRAPGDVVGPAGLVIEVKDVAGSSWPSWCKQAALEANGLPWVVVRRLRGVSDVGAWSCHYDDDGQVLYEMFGYFIAWWNEQADATAQDGSIGP